MATDSKEVGHVAHLENDPERVLSHTDYKALRARGLVDDSDAAEYVDPTLVITEEENRRLRRKIHRR